MKNLFMNIYSSFIGNSQNWRTNLMFLVNIISYGTSTQCGIHLRIKKDWTTDIYNSLDKYA